MSSRSRRKHRNSDSSVQSNVQPSIQPIAAHRETKSLVIESTSVDADEKAMEVSLTKYRELYTYSTDVLLAEHERFNRADDKAAKYSTMFIFLIGIVAYFEKWVFDRIVRQPDKYADIPAEWPLMVVAGFALLVGGIGWVLSTRVIMLRPFASRPLNNEVLHFFDKHRLLDIYDSFARRNIAAYEENKAVTDRKYRYLAWVHRMMTLVIVILAFSLILYCLYSLF